MSPASDMPANERLSELVENLLKQMEVEGTVRVQDRDTTYLVSIDTEDSALMIGRFGETLDALQTIIRLLAYKLELGDVRITVDVNAYRRGREEELLTFVDEVATRVKETGVAETLRPMSSYERHLVHEVVGQMDGLATESTGEGHDRRVTIRPA
jgi:spoIIIJ-associated protein